MEGQHTRLSRLDPHTTPNHHELCAARRREGGSSAYGRWSGRWDGGQRSGACWLELGRDFFLRKRSQLWCRPHHSGALRRWRWLKGHRPVRCFLLLQRCIVWRTRERWRWLRRWLMRHRLVRVWLVSGPHRLIRRRVAFHLGGCLVVLLPLGERSLDSRRLSPLSLLILRTSRAHDQGTRARLPQSHERGGLL